MIKSLFYFVFIVLFTGCSTSQINLQPHKLVIQSGGASSSYSTVPVAKQQENFSTLFINRNILRTSEGNLIVYEHAITDLQYEFEPGLNRIVSIVFDARQRIPLYVGRQLTAYQIALPSGQWLNLLVQQSDSQELHFLYGMSTAQLNKVIHTIDPNAAAAPYKHVLITHKRQRAIQSHWSTKKVHFVPLVVPFQISMRF